MTGTQKASTVLFFEARLKPSSLAPDFAAENFKSFEFIHFGTNVENVLETSASALIQDANIFFKLFSREDQTQFLLASADLRKNSLHWEAVARLANGRRLKLRVMAEIAQGRGAERLLKGVLLDVTEAEAEKSRATSEHDILKKVLATIPHSVFWKDVNSVYLGCNERFLKDANLATEADLVGKTDHDLPWGAAEGDSYRRFDAELVKSGRPLINLEERQTQANGKEIHVVTSKVLLYDAAGKVSGILGIYIDISELRNTQELVRSRESTLHANAKMAALGEMAASITHEINSPLMIIGALAGGMLQKSADGRLTLAEVAGKLETIEATTGRIAKIIQGMKRFARDESEAPMQRVDLAGVLKGASGLVLERYKTGRVQIEFEPLATSIFVNCRPTQVEQVLINLLNNAFDAVANLPGAWVRIRAEVEVDVDQVKILVTDSGQGVPESLRERIFQPFFTTKSVGVGTGLGLSISAGLIASHGGSLRYDSESANSQFEIRLPLARRSKGAGKLSA